MSETIRKPLTYGQGTFTISSSSLTIVAQSAKIMYNTNAMKSIHATFGKVAKKEHSQARMPVKNCIAY